MAKVPLPCMGTHSYSPPVVGEAAPPSASSRSRISRTVRRNSRSREPASRNIAAFTDALVVSGPGVNSSLLLVMSEILVFVAVAEIDARNQMVDHGQRIGRRLPDVLPANVSGIDDDVLDVIRRNLARIFAQHGEIGQFAGLR